MDQPSPERGPDPDPALAEPARPRWLIALAALAVLLVVVVVVLHLTGGAPGGPGGHLP